MQRQFQIVYTGKFNYKSSLKSTAANLAIILDTSPESALKILKQRKQRVLINNVSKDKVSSLVSNLEDVGLIVEAIEITSSQKPYRTNKHQSNTLFKRVSTPYKVFMIVFALISTSLLILVLSYLFVSGQSPPYGRITLTDFAGYSQDEMCLASQECHDIADAQSDDCYEGSMAEYGDWDFNTDEERDQAGIRSTNYFMKCFTDKSTGTALFPDPLGVRIDLINACMYLDGTQCLSLVGTQFKNCTTKFNIKRFFVGNENDIELNKSNNKEIFRNYYMCYLNENGNELFESLEFILF